MKTLPGGTGYAPVPGAVFPWRDEVTMYQNSESAFDVLPRATRVALVNEAFDSRKIGEEDLTEWEVERFLRSLSMETLNRYWVSAL